MHGSDFNVRSDGIYLNEKYLSISYVSHIQGYFSIV